MQKPYENPLKEHINACLQAYTGTDGQLKSCLEILLNMTRHDNPALLRFDELEPLQTLLNNLEYSPVEIPDTELEGAKEWIRDYLTEVHRSMLIGRFLKNNLVADESTVALFSAVNRRRVTLNHADHDENIAPESSAELNIL